MEIREGEWSEYEKGWTRQIIASVNAVRGEIGLTVKELRERLVNVGWSVSVANLSGMLSGDKRGSISIAEIAAFARALNVNPLYLVMGLPFADRVSDVRGPTDLTNETDIYDTMGWFFGLRFPALSPEDPKTGALRSARLSPRAIGRRRRCPSAASSPAAAMSSGRM